MGHGLMAGRRLLVPSGKGSTPFVPNVPSSSKKPKREGDFLRPRAKETVTFMKQLIQVDVNGMAVSVQPGSTALQACEAAGIEIPRFCYHERLLVAGNCRMCLVEIGGSPKPQASCALPVMPGMKIFTDSPRVKKARERVMEFLLLNHPLDCPICDQGGECDRQDESMAFGKDRSRGQGRYGRGVEPKRGVEDKDWNPMVKAIMTRCIHCTRCIRFASEIAGVADRGTSGRGVMTEVGRYVSSKPRATEMSGNLVDLCPVGALTAKSYGFKARPWELKSIDTVNPIDGLGASIRVQSRDQRVLRVLPRQNDEINQAWLDDKSRFSVDGIHHERRQECEAGLAERTLVHLRQRAKERHAAVDRVVSTHLPSEWLVASREWWKVLRQQGVNASISSRGAKGTQGGVDGVDAHHARSRATACSEADRVRLVGMNPRTDAPLLNTRLRESYLRDGVQVVSIGSALDLTFPVIHAGSDQGRVAQLLNGRHPLSRRRAQARRPLIMVGSEANESIWPTRRRRAHQRETMGSTQSGWTVLSRLHGTASSMASQVLGRESFQGWTPGSLTIVIGVEDADLARQGIALPTFQSDGSSRGRMARATLASYHDPRVSLSDVVLRLPSVYEMNGHWMNTEGRVQRGVSAQGSVGWRGSSTALDHARTGPRSVVLRGSDAVRLPVWRQRSVHGAQGSRAVNASGVVSLASKASRPLTHDYYLESHPVSRRSGRMALASLSLTRYGNFGS